MSTTSIALAAGDLAYMDSITGLVPVKVASVGHVHGWPRVTVKVTADRPAYDRGDTVTWPPTKIVPRASVKTRNHKYVITNNWYAVADSGERIDVFA